MDNKRRRNQVNPASGRGTLSIRRVALGLIAGVLLTGCAMTGDISGRGTPLPDDGPTPVISRTAALGFVRKVLTTGQGIAETQGFSLTVTDAEVTSFLNIRRELTQELRSVGLDQLGQFDELQGLVGDDINIDAWQELIGSESGSGSGGVLARLRFGLRNPRVYFRSSGQIVARGELAFLRWRQPVRFVIAPHATSGEMVLDFVEGQVGPLTVPEVIFDLLGKGIAEVLLLGQDYAEITQIAVTQGTLTISGRYYGQDG
jgi:hypothetical protein